MLTRFLSLPLIVRLALFAWAALLVGVSVRVAVVLPWKGTVVNIYITAAERWLVGDNVYLWQPGMDLYRNPPGVTPLLTPLTLVPQKLAGILWRLASAAVFLLGLRAWLRSLPSPLTVPQTGAVFLLSLPLALASLNNGQMNLLLAGLLMLGTAAVARERFHGGSLMLASAAGLKLYPAAVGLLLAAAYPRRILPGLFMGIAAFAVLPFLCQRTDYVLDMHRSLAFSMKHDERTHDDINRAPQDAFLILHALGSDPGKPAYQGVQLALAAGMALLVRWKSRAGGTPTEIAFLAFHLGCVWMTVFGPASEGPTYTLLAPSAALVLTTAHANRSQSQGRFLLALAAYMLMISPILRDAFPRGAVYRALGPLPAGGLLLLAVVVWDALRPSRAVNDGLFTATLSLPESRIAMVVQPGGQPSSLPPSKCM